MKVDSIPSVKISEAQRAALNATLAELENEEENEAVSADAEAGQVSGDQPGQADAQSDNAETTGDAAGDVDIDGLPRPAKSPMIPKARFDEAVSKERERADAAQAEAASLKTRVDAMEAKLKSSTLPEAPMDFVAEKAALRAKYDNGDIDSDEYEVERDKITVAQTSYQVRHQIVADQIASTEAQITADWNNRMTTWIGDNAEFMANPLRADAVTSLVNKYGADPELSNEALLAKVQKDVFDAFNWAGKAVAAPAASARDIKDAQAAAAAGAIPGAPTGGEGNRSQAGKTGVENIKQGEFGKLSKADQEALLGGEGTL